MFNYKLSQNFPLYPLCSVHSVVLDSGYLLKSYFSLTNSLKKDFQNHSQKFELSLSIMHKILSQKVKQLIN